MPMTPSQMLILQLAQARAPAVALSSQPPAVPDASTLLDQVAPAAAPQAPAVPTAPVAPEKPPTPEEVAAMFGLNPSATSPEVLQRQLEEVQKLITGQTDLDEKPVSIFHDIFAPSKAGPRRRARAAKDAASPIGMALRQYETRLAEALDRINAQQAAAEAAQQESMIEDQKRALAAAILFGNRGGLTPQAAAQFAQAGGQMSLEPTVATTPAASPLDSIKAVQALGLIPQQEVSNLLDIEQERFKQGPQHVLDIFNAETARANAQANVTKANTDRLRYMTNRAKTVDELTKEFSVLGKQAGPVLAEVYLRGLEDPSEMAKPQWQQVANVINAFRGRRDSVAEAMEQFKALIALRKDADPLGIDTDPLDSVIETLGRNLLTVSEDPSTPGGAGVMLWLDNLIRTGALKGINFEGDKAGKGSEKSALKHLEEKLRSYQSNVLSSFFGTPTAQSVEQFQDRTSNFFSRFDPRTQFEALGFFGNFAPERLLLTPPPSFEELLKPIERGKKK